MVGYYKIKQRIIQQNLSRYYRVESADILCEQFNKFVNTFKKEKEEMNEKYLWLEQDDERRNMSDREILHKYINYDKFVYQIQKRSRLWTCYINIRAHLV